MKLVDVSAFCGSWPFRDVQRTAAELKSDLQKVGVAHAWLTHIEGMFRPDPTHDNEALLNEVKGDGFFSYLAVINPAISGWERQVERARELSFHGWKLSPNYHGYDLGGDAATTLAKIAAESHVPLCIQMRMQDERGQHALMKVLGVPAQGIVELARKVPSAQIVACAPYLSELKILGQAPNVWSELSFCESGQSLNDALKHVPANRLLFGSHSPLHYPAAAAAKISGGIDISDEVLAQVAEGNARDLIAGR